MGAPRKYEIGYWVEEEGEIIGFKLDRDKVVGEFLNIIIEEVINEWKNQNKCNPLLHSNLLKTEIEDKKPNLLQSIHKLHSFTYYEVIIFLLYKQRVDTFFRKDYETLEWIRAQPIDLISKKDKDGESKEISINTSIVRPPSIYNFITITPEQALHDNDFYEKIMKLLSIVEASGKKNASTFSKILKMELLDGNHVTSEFGPILGVPNSCVASLRFHAFNFAKEIVINKFPELFDVIKNLSKGTAHKVKKSTKKEREKTNQSNNEDEAKKHGPIRMWTQEGGWITVSYEEAKKLKKSMPCRRRRKKNLINPEAQRKIFLSRWS